MNKEIINNLDNPLHLEKMYRDKKTAFKRAFNLVYLDIKEIPIAQIWNLSIGIIILIFFY
ncbi:hypothetical protein SAMN00777080_2740 [Aquiflexum balticum DSM 16537]|uniref:Uncharacterized protein n=1 Tax=Aquiflexum balticum DSM 16537 TaxID=758820 RepID=A0A1W2H5B4_9BACT|nr:hypothetical protein SAMN00777080_2740 [Aquiflexum balticum DSM 16537]